MASSRRFLGVSIGASLDGIDLVMITTGDPVTASPPRVESAIREAWDADTVAIEAAIVSAVRKFLTTTHATALDVHAVGLLLPADAVFATVGDSIAEQTGLTVFTDFSSRDRAAGGTGDGITTLADRLLFGNRGIERILVHLGTESTITYLPAAEDDRRIAALTVGPCGLLLDTLVAMGTRGRDTHDRGGIRAVQGHCNPELFEDWIEHVRCRPRLTIAEIDAMLQAAINHEPDPAGLLNDLLCTATHVIAARVAESALMMAAETDSEIIVSGGGTRNGLLWQLLQSQLPGRAVSRLDRLGVPILARFAAAAAVLAACAIDRVPGNLPHLSGAAGYRVLGRIIPGDPITWSRCLASMQAAMPATSALRAA
jgi:anhydro-N-acetylmuramic acid kinase